MGANRLPERLRKRILTRDPICTLAIPGVCTGISTEVHHVIDAQDGGPDTDDNLVGVCKPCHVRVSAQRSQKRAVASAWDWKRRPEKHPGIALD
jgi:5-methylcytosine-specific restriction enzyme A